MSEEVVWWEEGHDRMGWLGWSFFFLGEGEDWWLAD